MPQQSPRRCRQPGPLLTALPQECMTWDGECVIQETFHVFLGARSGNVARTAVHTAVHILGQLPEGWAAQASYVLSLEEPGPWEATPYHHYLPGKSGGNILRLGSWGLVAGVLAFREQSSAAPHPGPGPAGQTLSLSLRDRDMGASYHTGHTRETWGKPHLSLSLCLTLRTMGYPKAFSALRDLQLETLCLDLGSSHQQDRSGLTRTPAPIPHNGRDPSALVPADVLSPKASLLPLL